MNELKVALVWTCSDIKETLIFTLIKNLSKKKIRIVEPYNADLIIYGCYNWNEKLFHFYKFMQKKFHSLKIKNFLEKYQMKLMNRNFLNRKYKPIKLFYNQEIVPYNYISTDFVISGHLGISDENHLSFNALKEDLDWSSENIVRDPNQMVKKYGKYINIEDLLVPQGDSFLKKDRKMAFIVSQLVEPRTTMYKSFAKYFKIDGYGKAFNVISDFKILDLLKGYAFNFCPDHYCIPFFTNSRSAYAYLAKSLPIAYFNQAANNHINPKAIVNLNNHFHDNFQGIICNLQDDNFLRNFTKEPLLLKSLTLDKEIKFIKKILNCF
jgi:hypothetical protein